MEGKLPYMLRDSGAHWHDPSADDMLIGGAHQHLLDDMKTILEGGNHSHDMAESKIEGSQGWIGWSGEHVHKAILPNGQYILTRPTMMPIEPGAGPTPANTAGGRHKHEVTPDNEVSRGGQHIHTIQMPDGTVRKTLGHDEIKSLIEKGVELPSSIWDGAV